MEGDFKENKICKSCNKGKLIPICKEGYKGGCHSFKCDYCKEVLRTL